MLFMILCLVRLTLCYKKDCFQCMSLCQQPQYLCHILNACQVLLKLGLYKRRHNKVLPLTSAFLETNLLSDYQVVDLPGRNKVFPCEIALKALQPDVVVYHNNLIKLWIRNCLCRLKLLLQTPNNATKCGTHNCFKKQTKLIGRSCYIL